eukprot:m.39467 g.39467  ORF g.39467 m.39467 type:complete len:59 (+) comp18204_c0_seq2:987-1163(+)
MFKTHLLNVLLSHELVVNLGKDCNVKEGDFTLSLSKKLRSVFFVEEPLIFFSPTPLCS